jgi:hypothetical protein
MTHYALGLEKYMHTTQDLLSTLQTRIMIRRSTCGFRCCIVPSQLIEEIVTVTEKIYF